MHIKRAQKQLSGCTVRREGREVHIGANNLGYRIGVSRNGQVKSADVDYVKSKFPVAMVMPPQR